MLASMGLDFGIDFAIDGAIKMGQRPQSQTRDILHLPLLYSGLVLPVELVFRVITKVTILISTYNPNYGTYNLTKSPEPPRKSQDAVFAMGTWAARVVVFEFSELGAFGSPNSTAPL